MTGVLNQIGSELLEEDISAFASDLLQDATNEADIDTQTLEDGDVQAYLDDHEATNPPPKKKRSMRGYRRVTQALEGLFDFDLYLEQSKSHYYPAETE